MGNTREAFTTPLGRVVQGDAFEAQTKDGQGNLRVYKSGPNVGQPNPQYFMAVAYPKQIVDGATGQLVDNHEFNAFYALLDRVARTEWPTLFPTPGQPCVNPMFTFKVKDGDGTDRNGKSNATKEGFAGNWIVSFSSAYAPKVVRPLVPNPVNPQDWETLTYDPATRAKAPVKRGDFVRVAGSATGNDSPNTPGLYVNLDMVELIAYGDEIVSGPDAAGAFGGGRPAALPAGAQAAIGAPSAPGAAAFAAPPPPGTTAPPPPGAAAAAPPAGPVMLPAAGATTYDQYVVAGWTDAQLIASGFMAPPAAAAAPPPGNAPPPPGAAASPSPGAGLPATASPPPYDGYMQPGNAAAPASTAAAPPPPTSAPPATPSPTKTMTAAAGGATYESFITAGWSDAQLVAAGYIA